VWVLNCWGALIKGWMGVEGLGWRGGGGKGDRNSGG